MNEEIKPGRKNGYENKRNRKKERKRERKKIRHNEEKFFPSDGEALFNNLGCVSTKTTIVLRNAEKFQ